MTNVTVTPLTVQYHIYILYLYLLRAHARETPRRRSFCRHQQDDPRRLGDYFVDAGKMVQSGERALPAFPVNPTATECQVYAVPALCVLLQNGDIGAIRHGPQRLDVPYDTVELVV